MVDDLDPEGNQVIMDNSSINSQIDDDEDDEEDEDDDDDDSAVDYYSDQLNDDEFDAQSAGNSYHLYYITKTSVQVKKINLIRDANDTIYTY